jgi:hypothetical protein
MVVLINVFAFFYFYIYGGALYITLLFSAIGSFADNPPSDGQHQGVNVIKLFSSSPMLRQNKLECSSQAGIFKLVYF